MENKAHNQIQIHISFIETGLEIVNKLESQCYYREALSSFRVCMEHYVTLCFCFLCRQTNVDPDDILGDEAQLCFSYKEGGSKSLVLDILFPDSSHCQLYLITKKKPSKNPPSQLRQYLFEIAPYYVQPFTHSEYESVFQNCSNKASHSVKQVTLKEYDDILPFIEKFSKNFYQVISDCAISVGGNTDLLKRELSLCVEKSEENLSQAFSQVNEIRTLLKEIPFGLTAPVQHIQGNCESLVKIMKDIVHEQVDSLSAIEKLLNQSKQFCNTFTIAIVGEYASGKTLLSEVLCDFLKACGLSSYFKIKEIHSPLSQCNDEKLNFEMELQQCDLVIPVLKLDGARKSQTFNIDVVKSYIRIQKKLSFIVFNQRDRSERDFGRNFLLYAGFRYEDIYCVNLKETADSLRVPSETWSYNDATRDCLFMFKRIISLLSQNATIYKSLTFHSIIDIPVYHQYLVHQSQIEVVRKQKERLHSKEQNFKNYQIQKREARRKKLDEVRIRLNQEIEPFMKDGFSKKDANFLESWKKHVELTYERKLNDILQTEQKYEKKYWDEYNYLLGEVTDFIKDHYQTLSIEKDFLRIWNVDTDFSKRNLGNVALAPVIGMIHMCGAVFAPIGGMMAGILGRGMLFDLVLAPLAALGLDGFGLYKKKKEYKQTIEYMSQYVQLVHKTTEEQMHGVLTNHGLSENEYSSSDIEKSLDWFILIETEIVACYQKFHNHITDMFFRNVFKNLGYSEDDYNRMVEQILREPDKEIRINTRKGYTFSDLLVKRMNQIFPNERIVFSPSCMAEK